VQAVCGGHRRRGERSLTDARTHRSRGRRDGRGSLAPSETTLPGWKSADFQPTNRGGRTRTCNPRFWRRRALRSTMRFARGVGQDVGQTMLARLSNALARARAVPLAA
jgi:hypothetical protein